MQYVHVFDRAGAPLGVHAIAGDAESYLWAGTESGLYRFDGIHFHRVSTQPVRHVKVTGDGWIWAGGPAGLTAFRHGVSRSMLTGDIAGLASRGNQIVVSGGGAIWRGGIAGVVRTQFAANGVLSLDGQGVIWFGCGRRICSLGANNELQQFGPAEGVPDSDPWLAANRNDRGTLYAWTARKLCIISHGRVNSEVWAPPSGATDEFPGDPFRGRDGRFWLEGEYETENDVDNMGFPLSGKAHNPTFGEDSRGTLWAGSDTLGLLDVNPRRWIDAWSNWINAEDQEGLTRGCDSITRAKSGALFAACSNGIYGFDAVKQTWIKRPLPFEGASTVQVIDAGDASPDLWAILYSHGVQRITPGGRIAGTAYNPPAHKIDFRSLFRDRRGQLWLGSKSGLFRIDEGRPGIVRAPLEGGEYAVTFATGPDGTEWVGYDGGIARLDGDRWKRVVPVESLANFRVGTISVGPGPEFWVSYRALAPFSRIYLSNGRWKRQDFDAASGYGPNETRYLLRDRRGWLWRGTTEGLYVSDGVHLAPEDWIRFTTIHNMPDDSVSPFGLMEDRDGSIWVSTGGGVARIDPDPAWFAALPKKPIRLSRVRWQGKENLWPSVTEALAAGRGDLDLDFAQWPDAVPRKRVLEYRLAPRESAWRTTLDGSARYESLPAGRYRFEVRDRFGSAQTWEFRLAETFPYTMLWWFGSAGLAPAGWLVWRRQVRARYWKEKTEFLALQKDDEAAVERSGELVAGRYRVESEIGQGGFARVWKALDVESGATVAIKFLVVAGELDQWQRERFEKETGALLRLRHPGIVRLLDSGWPEGSEPWLAITWIDGPDLREVLKSGPVPREKAAEWILQIGEALGEAHSQGVLHRDLKPENILIEHVGGENERVVIVDFGAATVYDGMHGGRSALLLGSFDYIAPERVAGLSSPATDVYALSAVAFEMLTGVRYRSLADGSESGLRKALQRFGIEVARLLAAGVAYTPEERPGDIRGYAAEVASVISAR